MDEVFLEDEETGLLVSNLGRIVGLNGGVLKGHCVKSGHILISTSNGVQVFAHRLVARNFIPNPKNLPFINHKDENPKNNRVDNIEWCDSKYNNTYGTIIEKHKKTLVERGLTTRCLLVKDGVEYIANSIKEMSDKTGISPSCVANIIYGKVSHIFGFHLPNINPGGGQMKAAIKVVLTNGIEKKTFESINQASKYIGVHSSKVCALVSGSRFSAKGWHIVGRKPNYSIRYKGSIELVKGCESMKCESVKEAASKLFVSHALISLLISGKVKSCKGWRISDATRISIEEYKGHFCA